MNLSYDSLAILRRHFAFVILRSFIGSFFFPEILLLRCRRCASFFFASFSIAHFSLVPSSQILLLVFVDSKKLCLFLFRSLSPILAGGPFMFTLITLCFSPGLSKQVLVLLVRMRILFSVLIRGVCRCR